MKDDIKKAMYFGQHFECECCHRAVLTAVKGLRRKGTEQFVQPLCAELDGWDELVSALKATGEFVSATLCGRCGQ